jgi:hypothetical protein
MSRLEFFRICARILSGNAGKIALKRLVWLNCRMVGLRPGASLDLPEKQKAYKSLKGEILE